MAKRVGESGESGIGPEPSAPVDAKGARSTVVVQEMEQVGGCAGSERDLAGQPYLTPEQVRVLERARAGDQRALRHLYESHQAQVRGHLYRLLGPDPDLDDLVQTVFSRAFNALDTFKGGSTLSTWIYRITANTTHNLLRQRFRRDRVVRALEWFNRGRGTKVAREQLEARDEAMRLLLRIPPELREIFVLYHYQGLTLQEIAQIIDRPLSTVGDRLGRARKLLRDLT